MISQTPREKWFKKVKELVETAQNFDPSLKHAVETLIALKDGFPLEKDKFEDFSSVVGMLGFSKKEIKAIWTQIQETMRQPVDLEKRFSTKKRKMSEAAEKTEKCSRVPAKKRKRSDVSTTTQKTQEVSSNTRTAGASDSVEIDWATLIAKKLRTVSSQSISQKKLENWAIKIYTKNGGKNIKKAQNQFRQQLQSGKFIIENNYVELKY